MNGAVPKADFVRGQNRLIGGNHVKKNSYFRDADVGNAAVGPQLGKSLFTTQHQVAPQPTVDQVTPARQIGDKLAYGAIDALSEKLGTKHVTDVTPKPQFPTNMKNFPIGSDERRTEYARRGWAQDETTSPAKHEAKPHVPHSTKASYGYSESGEFIQTGGTPRSKFLKPLSNYNANERKQLIESGTISSSTYKQPSGGDNSYLLGGNTAMRNWVDTANQKI